MNRQDLEIPARDGFGLAATGYSTTAAPGKTVVVVNAATAVPRSFYRPLAEFLASRSMTVITYDYRGIGGSRPSSLRGFSARAADWALQDMAGVVDWAHTQLKPERLTLVGHSFGGQTAGLLPNASLVSAMATVSAQTGYWRVQGGIQKWVIGCHTHLTLPILSRVFGYLPWSWFSSAEDLPKGVAIDWSGWCRQPGYLIDDPELPIERFMQFRAPVLAISVDDDDWGLRRNVEAMMRHYPNVEWQHVTPAEADADTLGHFGYFREKAKPLWGRLADWLVKPGD